jgi:hypothetical protein
LYGGDELANKSSKYNWIELKKDWLLGNYKTLLQFANHHGIKYGYVKQKAAEGNWHNDKRTNDNQKTNEIIQKTVAAKIEVEVSRNTKHLHAYDLALDACVDVLKDELKKGIDMFGNSYISPVIIHSKLARVVESLEKIQKGQRLGEGLDLNTDNGSLEKLDDILQGLSRVMEDD